MVIPAWAVLLAVRASPGPPPVVPATAPDTAFSAERAMRHIAAIAIAPRPPGSAEHRRVVALVERELAGLGLAVERQQTVAVSRRGGVAGRVVNLLARLPGTRPSSPAILLVTHHDGVWSGPAAGDNASGVAVVLEILRALRAGPRLDHDVIALFTDGEEAGLLGAAAFVGSHPWAREVGVAINVDARGTHGRSVMFEATDNGPDLIRALRRVGDIETTSLWRPVFRLAGGDTDLSELRRLGRPGLNFGFLDGFERYHTIEDDVAHLDARSVQHHGDQVLAVTRILSREPLPRAESGDATWFAVAGIGLVIYSGFAGGSLTVMAVGLTFLLVARLRRGAPSARPGVAGGAALALGAAVVGAVTAGAAIVAAPGGAGDPAIRHWYAAAIVVGVAAVTVGTWRAARRFHDPTALSTGGILIWAGIAAVTHWRAPEASFAFAWPALFLAAAEHYAVKGRRGVTLVRTLGVAGVLAIVVPTWYPVAVLAGINDGGALVIGVLVPLLLWPVFAALDDSLLPTWRRWAVAGLTVSLALTGLVAAVRSAPGVSTAPRVAYAVDVTEGRAWLVTPASGDEAWRAAVAGAAGNLPDRGPRAAPAWLGRVFPRRMAVQSVAVRSAAAPSTLVTVVRNVEVGPDRELTLRIEGQRDAFDVELATSTPVFVVSIDGHPFASRQLPIDRPWSVRYIAPSDSGMTVSLTTKSAGVLEILVRTSGLPGSLDSALRSVEGHRMIQPITTRFQRVDFSPTRSGMKISDSFDFVPAGRLVE